MRIAITGVNLPGRVFCRPDGSVMGNVHVGVQVRRDPGQLFPADEPETGWDVDAEVVRRGAVLDFRGPAVQGRPGGRFVYLTWGEVSSDGEFEMFRRAKVMLDRVAPDLIESAATAGCLAASVDLTGNDGGPRPGTPNQFAASVAAPPPPVRAALSMRCDVRALRITAPHRLQ